jgi:hypothetical protein
MLALAFGGFGLLLLGVAVLVLTSLRKNQLQLRILGREVAVMTDRLRTPEQRAELTRRIEAIEAQKRQIHGRFDADGT